MLDRIFSRMARNRTTRWRSRKSCRATRLTIGQEATAAAAGPQGPGGPPQGVDVVRYGLGPRLPPASGVVPPRPSAAAPRLFREPAAHQPVLPARPGPIRGGPPSGRAVPSQGSSLVAAASIADGYQAAPRKPSRFLTARSDCPKDCPIGSWKKTSMARGKSPWRSTPTNWTPEKVAEFARYDLNHDGIITAAECLKVEKAKTGPSSSKRRIFKPRSGNTEYTFRA